MKKEFLLSLVAAGVIPTAALANIDVTEKTGINDATAWQNNGLGSVSANGDLLNGGSIVVSGASAGSLSFDIDVKKSDLPVGNYVINAVGENLKLTIDGKDTNKFTLTGDETTVAVKIQGASTGNYSLTKLTLEIDLDFATLKEKLEALTEEVAEGETGKYTILSDTVAITAIDYKDAEDKPVVGRQYYTGLAAGENALKEEINAMKALIAKLEDENLETYLDEELELWTEPSGLQNKLQDLLNKIAKRNAEVEKLNTLSANWGTNQATKATVENALTDAKAEVDELDLTDEFVAAQTQEALEAFNEFYEELNGRLGEFDVDGEEINVAGKQMVDEEGNPVVDEEGNPVWVYEPFDTVNLNSLKEAVKTAKNNADADAAAFTEIEGYISDVKKEYNKHLTAFMDLHVGNQSATWTSELTAIKDEAVGKLEKIEKIGARDNKVTAQDIKTQAITDLQDKYEAVNTAANNSDNAYNSQNDTLKEAENDLTALKTRIDAITYNTELQNIKPGIETDVLTEYNIVKEALDAVRTKLDADKVEYAVSGTLDISENTDAISTLSNNVQAVEEIFSEWQENEDAIKNLEENLSDAQNALETANTKLKTTLNGIEGVSEVNLVNQFAEAKSGCDSAIEFSRTTNNSNLKNGESADIKLTYATNGVNEYVGKAAPTAAKFTDAVNAYKDLTTALNKLENQVNGATILSGNSLTKKTYSDKWLSEDKTSGYEVSIKTILEGIQTAANKKADAIYEAIAAVDINPNGVKENIANDIDTFAAALTTGNMGALTAKANEYNSAINADDADDVFGPGLPDVKALMNTEPAVGTEGDENYQPEVKHYTANVQDMQEKVTEAGNTVDNPKTDEVETVTGAYQALDESIVDLYNKMVSEVGGLMEKCKTNVKALKDYNTAYGNIITELVEWVEENSNEPATTAWLKHEYYIQIFKDKNALDKAIQTAYNDNNLTDDTEKNGKKNTLSTDITKFKNAVTTNETNHNAQLGYAEVAIAEIQKAIDDVNNANYDASVTFKITVDGEVKETNKAGVIDILKDKQKGLQGLHKQVSDDYAALQSVSESENVYKDLVEEVKAIVNAVASDYYRAVKEANEAISKTAMGNQNNNLDIAYKDAIGLYNKLTKEVAGNDDYNTYVALLTENINSETVNLGHAELQKHYQTMREIQDRVDTILNNALPEDINETDLDKYQILTEDDFSDVKTDVTNAVAAMTQYNEDLTNAVNAYAQDYLFGEFGKITVATTTIQEAMATMETAKMSEDEAYAAVSDAITHVSLAQAYLDTDYDNTPGDDGVEVMPTPGNMGDVKSGDVEKYLTNMPACLAELALVDINTAQVLADFWNTRYNEADAALKGYQDRYDKAAPYALDAALVTPALNLSKATGMIRQLNVWAQNVIQGMPAGKMAVWYGKEFTIYGEDEEGNKTSTKYNGLIPELEAALELAKAGAEGAEAAKANNEYNIAKLAELQGVRDEIEDKVKEMHAKIGALGLTVAQFEQIPTEVADEELATLKAYLVDENGDDTKYAGVIENAFLESKTAVEYAIAAAYAKAEEVEKAYLQILLSDIQADFNTKYEADELTNADELDKEISKQRTALNDANLGVTLEQDEEGNDIALTPAERMTALKAIEDALFAIDLGTMTPNKDATDVVKTELASQADDVDTAIQNLQTALTELQKVRDNEVLAGWTLTPVQNADADTMAEELAAIKAAYEADNSVETKGDYYKDQLTALLGKVNTGLDNVAAAKTAAENEISKRRVSNYWADAMEAEIATLEEYYTNLCNDIKNYTYHYLYEDDLKDKIEGQLEYNDNNEVIGGGLITLAKYRINKARQAFLLTNENTSWNEIWEYEFDDKGNVVNSILVNEQGSVKTSLYKLDDIYTSVDNLALQSARTDVVGWKSEARTEIEKAAHYVNNGTHINQVYLNEELKRLRQDYYTISVSFTEVTEYARYLMTAKTIIEDAKALVTSAEENFYMLGDVDGNEKVTGNDFARIIDIIMENTTLKDIADERSTDERTVSEDQVLYAADVNTDSSVGIGDAVKVMRYINDMIETLDETSSSKIAPRRGGIELAANLVQGKLCIDNSITLASVLVELRGVSESDITLATRAAGMNLITKTMSDGTVRVVVIAADGTTLADNTGAVLNMAGNATLTKVVVSDIRGTEYTIIDNGETTAIESITNAIKSAGEKIYNVGGQMMNTLKKGINIIRNADGSSTKILNK